MSYEIHVGRIVKDYRDASGKWLDSDYREIEPYETYEIEVDAEDISEDGLAAATLDAMPRGVWEASIYPISSVLEEHTWLSDTYTDPYTGHVTETTVRLKGEYTTHERAEIFSAV